MVAVVVCVATLVAFARRQHSVFVVHRTRNRAQVRRRRLLVKAGRETSNVGEGRIEIAFCVEFEGSAFYFAARSQTALHFIKNPFVRLNKNKILTI